MKTFKTLGEFKRVLAVGDKLHAMHHINNKDMGIREVCFKNSKEFALNTDGTPSYCNWPKASHCKVENEKLIVLVKDIREFKGGLMQEGNPEYDKLPFLPILTYSFA